MTDESQLRVRKKDNESSLAISSARSALVARGRRDAALLTFQARVESEEQRSGAFPGWPVTWFGLGYRRIEEGQNGSA